MKRSTFLVPFVAALILLVSGFVAAGQIGVWTSLKTEFNGVDLERAPTGFVVSGIAGETVPVRVTFKAAADVSDVRVKVSMEGHREEISASTERFDVVKDSVYSKLLTLELPEDLKDLTKEFTLYVDVVSASDKTSKRYTVRLQRDSYSLNILSADYPSKVSAGETVPVSVVAENNGYNDEEDVYVEVSIPSLEISRRGYVGDLVTSENSANDNEEDSREKTVYLPIPEDAQAGVYDVVIRAYNKDSQRTIKGLISIADSESLKVFAVAKNKDVNAGETVTYDLVIVNSADDVRVFNLKSSSDKFLDVSVPSVVTVGPDSSETVTVTVDVSEDADIGTYPFSVDVEDKQVSFNANVVGESVSPSIVALTVVLAIIFVVLLVVLIVLLTRKEKTVEEVETSYY